MDKKLSIIIPVYGVEKYLRECLDSAINQTYENTEIICINDCSPDNSIDILKEYSKKDKRIKIIDLKKNVRQGVARNKAMEIATGDFITFLDADDYIQKDGYELAMKKVSKDTDIVLFGFESFDENSKLNFKSNNYDKYYNKILPYFLKETHCNDFNFYLNIKKIPVSPCKIYRSEFLNKNKIRFINGRYIHEDEGWFIKWMSCSPVVVSIEDRIYKRRVGICSTVGKVSLSRKQMKDSMEHKYAVAQDALEYLKSSNEVAYKIYFNHLSEKAKLDRKKYFKYTILSILTLGLVKNFRNKKYKYGIIKKIN